MMGLPQPPEEQMGPPAPQQMTLGQANPQQMPQGPPQPQNPYLQSYQEALQVARQMVAPAMRQPLAPAPPENILKKILTFGSAGSSEERYRQGFNVGVENHNKDLELVAAQLARGMMHDQATGDLANFNQQLRMLTAGLGVKRFLAEDADRQVQQRFRNTVPEATTPEGRRLQRATGLTPSEEFPARLQRAPGGGFQMPGPRAAPGSPAAAAGLGDQGGGGAAGVADMKPNELPEDYATRKTREGKIAEKTQTEQATNKQEFENNAKLVEEWFNNPKYDMSVAQTLMPGMGSRQLGPWKGTVQRIRGKGGPAYLDLGRTKILPLVRALEAGTKGVTLRGGKSMEQLGLASQLERLVNNEMSKPEAATFKATVLDAIGESRRQRGGQQPSWAQTTTTTSSATPSTGMTSGTLGKPRRLSSGKLIMEEP